MKAAAITQLGGPDVIRMIDLAAPDPKPGHALVRVKAVGLNWLDVLIRREDFGLAMPHVAGSDVSGFVEYTSPGSRISVGTEVIVNPAAPCGQCVPCQAGTKECQFVRIFGLHTPGGYGELVSVPEVQLRPKPPRLSFEQAAAFPLDFLTAWRMLVTRGGLKAGETVFIWGASGALGVAAVQLASYLGAKVLAAAGALEYAGILTRLGAHDVLNYKDDDVIKKCQDFSAGAGIDLVFESIGKSTISTSTQIVRPGGRIVICGTRSGDTADIDLADLYYRQVSIIGSRMGTDVDFSQVYALIDNGSLDVHVGRTMKIDQIVEAHRELENRQFVGKLVLQHQ